jgi:hypothetical protein
LVIANGNLELARRGGMELPVIESLVNTLPVDAIQDLDEGV